MSSFNAGGARLRAVSSLAVLAACLTWASAASAEDTAPGDTRIEEVVVTATKRPEVTKDVPIALTAFGQKELAARQPRDVTELANAIPNISLTSAGNTLFIDPVIRGISSNTRNAGVESGLAVYVDGVYTGRPETFNEALEDARTVEILRGPQGTLFGKNAIAGALSVTTQDPTPYLSGRASVEVGSESELRASTDLNAPLGDGAGMRISLYREKRDGYVKNLFDGSTVGNDDYWGGRVKTKFTLAPSVDLVLAADGRWDNRHPYFGETPDGVNPVVPPPQPVVAPGPFTINEDHKPDKETRTLWGTSATLNYHTDGGATLSSISAYRYTRHRFTEDNDSSPLDAIFNDFFDKQRQVTQELRVVSPDTGRFKYAAGLFYFHQDSMTRHIGGLGTDFAIPGLIPGGIVKTVTPAGTIKTDSYAAYADASYALTSRLDLLAGARVTRENKSATFSVTPDAAILPLFYAIPEQGDRRHETDLSPTIGLRYKPTDELTAYARIARGYKSGGWNLDFVGRIPGAPAPTLHQLGFQPEKVTNYEAGLKGDMLAHRLTFDVAGFWMDYRNLQVTQFFGLQGGAVTSNAATATIKGVEGDMTAVVAQGLTIATTFGYNDARYDKFPNVDAAGDSADGKRLPGPGTTASLNASYNFALPVLPGTITAFAEYSWRGAGFVTPLNEARLRVPGRALTNARLTWASGHWSVTASVDNLFNKTYIDTTVDDPFATFVPNEQALYGRPRTYGFRVTTSF